MDRTTLIENYAGLKNRRSCFSQILTLKTTIEIANEMKSVVLYINFEKFLNFDRVNVIYYK